MKLGNYKRFDKKIRFVKDSPVYLYGRIEDGKPIKPFSITRFSQILGFCPSIVFENRFSIKKFEKPKEIMSKI